MKYLNRLFFSFFLFIPFSQFVFSEVYYLSNQNFITIDGLVDSDEAGQFISKLGDINDDGYDDFAISSVYDSTGSDVGAVSIFFGQSTSSWSSSLDIDDADIIITGENSGDQFGDQVAAIGDVNDDGVDDIAICAPGNDDNGTDAGIVYVIYGQASWSSGEVSISSIADASFLGEAVDDGVGILAQNSGDFNGDGIVDLLIGVPFFDNVTSNMGKIYLFFGSSAGWSLNTDISTADQTYTQAGVSSSTPAARSNYQTGSEVDFIDIDQDGYADIVAGQSGYTVATGTYTTAATGRVLVFQGNSSSLSLTDYFTNSTYWSEGFGRTLANVGDVDGDNYPDILSGFAGYYSSGDAALTHGDSSIASLAIDTKLECGGNYSSSPDLSGNGDFNSDSYTDLLLRTNYYDSSYIYHSHLYLLYGQIGGWSSSLVMSADHSYEFIPENDDHISLARFVGDIDGDGLEDLLIGVSSHDSNGYAENGRVYLMLGVNFNCENEVSNPSADSGTSDWTAVGSATTDSSSGNNYFSLPAERDYLYQDITVPSGTSFAYLSAYMKAQRLLYLDWTGWYPIWRPIQEGFPYIFVYEMNSANSVVNRHKTSKVESLSWTYSTIEIDELDASTTKLRLFLKRSTVRGVNHPNEAHFDEIKVTFDCT